MSNEPPPEKKLPLHRRYLPTTLAGKTALITALALFLILILVWILRLFGSQSVSIIHAVSVTHRIVEVVLVIVIPLVLYWGIRRWNQVIEGEYPDIDRAWEAGIKALAAKGVAATDYPIFLILGSAGEETEHGLMEALDTKLDVHGVPEAAGVNHALQWYMSSDAIYLFCPGASSLSALMGRWSQSSMKISSRRTSLSRASVGDASEDLSPASGSAKDDVNSSKVGLPKIERSAKPSSQPGPASGAAPAPAATAKQAGSPILKKESSMQPAAPNAQPDREAPQPYLGTIQHNAVDSSPQDRASGESAAKGTASSPRNSVFDVPPTQKPAASSSDALRPAPRYEGTISFDQYSPAEQAKPGAATGSRSSTNTPSANRPPQPARTSQLAERENKSSDVASTASKPSPTPVAMPRANGNKKVALPASLDTSDQLPRLRYVCKLLKRVRRPMCGINGAITLIPFELSRVGPLQLSAIAQAARGDVETVQQTLGVRSPVTAVLVGLEQDKGFTELVRRLQSGLLTRRLGGRFDLRSRPTPEELNTHSDRLCDAFEDWVYRLFSREDGLAQQRGNRKLYALTCKIRHELKPRLRIVLGQAFGCESTENAANPESDDSFFFSGCYFAASGAITGQAAFVKGVLKDKLLDEQSKVQWTEESRKTQQFLNGFAVLGWVIVALLAVLYLIQYFLWR